MAIIDTTSEHTYQAVRRDIIWGALEPRRKLRLDALRTTYGTSVSTLREILHRLVGEGLVVATDQRGFTVAPVTHEEFRQLAEVRDLLEATALRQSFARGDLEWEAQVVAAHHKLGSTERDMLAGDRSRSEHWKHYDKEFHHALIAASGSSELIAAHSAIFDRYLRYQIVAVIFRGEVAASEHRELLACALSRDAARATQILNHHISACVEHTIAREMLEHDQPITTTPVHNSQDETVAGALWRRVRNDILAGHLAPMQKLKLDNLRSVYGGSVSTLREILNRLATEGFVIAEGQRGFEVAPISPSNLKEIAELRMLLEGHALDDSFANGDVDWEARIVSAYHKLASIENRMRRNESCDIMRWKRYDWEFHQALIGACGSKVLMQLHGAVFEKYLRYQLIALSFRGDVAATEHRALLDAALNRDAPAARSILEHHLRGGVEHALASGTIGDGCAARAS